MARNLSRFTVRARAVLRRAQEEAERLHDTSVRTEHLLLALVEEPEATAGRVLTTLGLDLATVREAVERVITPAAAPRGGQPTLSPQAQRALELAVAEARRLNQRLIGTEHLLVGLLQEGEGLAAVVLASLGVTVDQVRHYL